MNLLARVMMFVGYGLITINFLSFEWQIIRREWVQILNPFLHFEVIFLLLQTGVFWVSVLLILASIGVQYISTEMK